MSSEHSYADTLANEREHPGSVSVVRLNEMYTAVLSEGRVYLEIVRFFTNTDAFTQNACIFREILLN